ncbi:MAG TPA: ABC transporter substrate-binding protein [Pseudolabrys sp.]|nr:ABC transporter substrate-binding protein [Pseudolabrys sp.]
MRRRDFIKVIGGGAVAWPPAARAENSRRIPRIGVLWHAGSSAEEGRYFTGFVDGLRGLGYLDGINIILEHRFPNEMPDRFRNMAAELVSLNVDVLVSVGSQTAFYAKDATRTIPIVFIFVPDPVGSKFVMSLARPGGNATGLTHFAADLIGKRLEFLKETSPGLARVGLLVNPDTEVARLYTHVTDSMAQKLGLSNHTFSARSRDELEPAFDAMMQAGMQAVTINSEGLAYQQREFIANLAIARRLPLSVWSRETLEAGALMSYGADQPAMCRRAAVFVDKILKGAKPADLPVEEPTKIEFLLNKKTAKALGLAFPHTLLVAATEVIE